MRYLNSRQRTPEVCPVCGEDVPRGALACPECGADHNSGWKPGALDADGLPDEDFDYEEFVRDEFGPPRTKGLHPVWWVTAVLVLILFLALALWGGF